METKRQTSKSLSKVNTNIRRRKPCLKRKKKIQSKPYNKFLMNLVCSVRTGKYFHSFFSVCTKTSGKYFPVWTSLFVNKFLRNLAFTVCHIIWNLYYVKVNLRVTIIDVYVRTYVRMCVCMYVCMYVCTYG